MDRKLALENCLVETAYSTIPHPYRGKVRDVYELKRDKLGIIVTDRISAFDHVMPQPIPFKGQILNQLAAFSFRKVEDIISTHILDVPHPNVTIAKKCEPIPVEVVIRGYLTGHAWRVYKSGRRELCGVSLPPNMIEHQAFPEPILTPATKAKEGHDEDISEKEIIDQGLVDPALWDEIRHTAFNLFKRGSEVATGQGLILVDTKYEFGLYKNDLTLIDEVHTSDSSRYFYADGYEERLESGKPQKQLSKEFLREWLMEQGFKGLEGQRVPNLPDSFRWSVYQRYKELYEILTGSGFSPRLSKSIHRDIESALMSAYSDA